MRQHYKSETINYVFLSSFQKIGLLILMGWMSSFGAKTWRMSLIGLKG
jgi:hypothetical protein